MSEHQVLDPPDKGKDRVQKSFALQFDLFNQLPVKVEVKTGIIKPVLPGDDPFLDELLDKMSSPSEWTDICKEKFAIELLSNIWDDVCCLIQKRISSDTLSASVHHDYQMTLGWILGYWSGAVPINLVLQYENALQKDVYSGSSYQAILETLQSHPLIQQDLAILRETMCGYQFLGVEMNHE
ncbi:hypothetical protein [Undibacterium oligocarboniphilum]|uniref:Uncharacterized protein n=1 Tax=Undibacterium oligocarboniphilum TaxID=666702 RepID=A0A850QH98_9BURK|nr:hypothetical protein [Undibacterium oligocarboniphilum]MBC3871463.1 hypothetical protein [Undibacterium oligocarboniphilum]NVO78961.1 hypothetical protein [Undibacterium oligocarboniphilum]